MFSLVGPNKQRHNRLLTVLKDLLSPLAGSKHVPKATPPVPDVQEILVSERVTGKLCPSPTTGNFPSN